MKPGTLYVVRFSMDGIFRARAMACHGASDA